MTDIVNRLRDRAYSGLPDRLLEEAADEIERLRVGVWIPIAERLPEKGVPVIGWFPGATHSFECALNEHDGVWCEWGTGIYLYEDERPTHWMPFPDGPTDAK